MLLHHRSLLLPTALSLLLCLICHRHTIIFSASSVVAAAYSCSRHYLLHHHLLLSFCRKLLPPSEYYRPVQSWLVPTLEMIIRQQFLRAISTRILTTSGTQLSNPKVLTPQDVELSLKSCSSDVDTIKLFLWFAHQPNYFHKQHSFDYMVSVLTRITQKFESVKGVVRWLESDGCCIKGQTFLMLLRIYSRGKMYDKALEAFYEMKNYGYLPNTFVCNIILDVLFKIGDVEHAIEFFGEIEKPNFLTYNTLLCHLYQLNNLVGVCNVLKVMVGERFRPNPGTFFMVLDCLCKAGRMKETMRVLGLMIISGISLTVNVWSILIDGYCKVGQFVIASQLLEKMVDAGYAPNVVTYTFLVKGFMKSGIFDRARGIMMTMESKGCVPDLFLYNVLIHGMPKFKNCNKASIGFPEIKVQHDSLTLSGYFIKSGILPCAVDIYNDMLSRGSEPDGHTYAGLLSALCSSGKIDYAVNLYQGIVRENLCLDAHIPTVITNELIKVGKCHTAITLFKEASAKNLPLDVVSYSVWFKGLIKDGRLEEIFGLYCQMKEHSVLPNACVFNYMLHGFCKARDIKLIKWLLIEMANTGVQPNCATLEIIIRFLNILSRDCSMCKMQNLGMRCPKCRGISETFISLFEDSSEDMLDTDDTGSEDFPDVAASFV